MNRPPLSDQSENVLAAAALEGLSLGHSYLGVEHLFLGLTHEKRDVLAEAFESISASVNDASSNFTVIVLAFISDSTDSTESSDSTAARALAEVAPQVRGCGVVCC